MNNKEANNYFETMFIWSKACRNDKHNKKYKENYKVERKIIK